MLHAYVKILDAKFHTITWLDLVQSTQAQKHILLRLQPSWKKTDKIWMFSDNFESTAYSKIWK